MNNKLPANNKTKNASLVDALDRVVEKGALVHGDIALNLADIDLIYLRLTLALGSSSLFGDRKKTGGRPKKEDLEYISRLEDQIKKIEENISRLATADIAEKNPEKGIAKLVLTVLELIHNLLEREALRKIERGELNKTQIRKIGLAFQAFDKKIIEMKKIFGIEEDLNIDLGPLGKLL